MSRPLAVLAALSLAAGPVAFTTATPVAAAPPTTVTVAGSLQDEIGCAGDWDPACAASHLEAVGDGTWSDVFTLPAGEYEFKIALNDSWTENYGAGGAADGGNIPLIVAESTELRFTFDETTKAVSVAPTAPVAGTSDADRALATDSLREPLTRERFYFVMPDRFANGNTANDDGGYGGGPLESGLDPTRKGFYHGGDLAGLIDKMDYIKGMGTTAIWMTPMFKNKPVQGEGDNVSAGYHGYWITDFTTMDPHFGTNAELKKVVDEAHKRGMKVFFDVITNHTADVVRFEPKDGRTPYAYVPKSEVPYKDADGNVFDDRAYAASDTFPPLDPQVSYPYVPFLPEGEEDVKVPAWLNDVNVYHNRGDSTFAGESVEYGDFFGLDDLFTEKPEVREGMTEIFKTWAQFGIDGYRIDTVKHVNMEFWQYFVPEVEKAAAAAGKPNFFMFGEVFDADPAFTSQYTTTGKLPATLDFPFQQEASDYVARNKPATELRDLFAKDDYYTDADSNAYSLPTFLGNHDMGRIGRFIAEGNPDASEAELLRRDKLAHSLMYLTRGQPVVYYGDEQGFTGDGGDQDARQDMFATQVESYQDDKLINGEGTTIGTKSYYDEKSPMYKTLAKLSSLTSKHPALRDGAQIHRYASGEAGVYAFSRIDRERQVEYVVAVNNAQTAKSATLQTFSANSRLKKIWPPTGSSIRTDDEGRTSFTVPPLSAAVWRATAPLAPTPGVVQPDLMSPSAGEVIGGRSEIRAFVPGTGFATTTFAARPVGTADWTVLGADDNAPYRVFADTSAWPKGTLLELRAVVEEADGGVAATGGYALVGDPVKPVDTGNGGGPVVQPGSVSVPGDLNSEMGCAGDWDPACPEADLALDANDEIWKGEWQLPGQPFAYKVAINDSWDENYGAGAVPGGGNIELPVPSGGATVKFWYDHRTKWIADSVTSEIVTAPGSFQSEMGCAADWDPACMRSWLQDPDKDGTYTLTTTEIPAGSYATKVAHDLAWDENYGEGGAPNGADIAFTVGDGEAVTFAYDVATRVLTITTARASARPDISTQQAVFVDRQTIAWRLPEDPQWKTYRLHWSADADLAVDAETVTGGRSIPLTYDPAGLSDEQLAEFPQLEGYGVLRVPDGYAQEVRAALRGQLAVAAYDDTNALVAATGLQVAGVLDDIYARSAKSARLGVTFSAGRPTLRLWAPTAQSARLRLYDGEEHVSLAMTRQDASGVWTRSGPASWNGRQYAYEVEVFAPADQAIVTNVVTDPYSLGLTANSTRSVIVDLKDPELMPAGWKTLTKPALAQGEDSTIYELQVRDFSITDETVPVEKRGTYLAFTEEGSAGMKHLAALAEAGLNTVHLLPTFDIATIEERRANQQQPACDLASMPPDSEQQQECVSAVADEDGFNWGYDPYHYTTPEGSYATDPDGTARTKEFREMVAALNRQGLRVVQDVVYNHTTSAGQAATSVLDRVVPGYYQRLNASGQVETSTCCANTAPENVMMGKLVVDSVVTWARDYKVDGFRFDLMGHHPKQNMLDVRAALDALTLEKDGVDGRSVYVYGEGWNFGEVADGARFEQATQLNMAGTGIGTFNDRLRDAVRGGGPFDENPRIQGFGSGLWTDPNGDAVNGSTDEQRARLELYMDQIKVGLAGNLGDYTFVDRTGTTVKGSEVLYNGAPTGYAADPSESVQYVDAHDNETLYDALAYKLPQSTPMADRVRMNTVSLATVVLGQGPAFFHAGTDILRSKSLDRNSYNSGDWFNRVDWSLQENTFGSGLPPKEDNETKWPFMKPLLADPALDPDTAAMQAATAAYQDLLEIRRTSPLLRLGTAERIQERVGFPVPSNETPGVIVMTVDDSTGEDVDPSSEGLVVVFNATDAAVSPAVAGTAGASYALHAAQAEGSDPVVRTASFDGAAGAFSVPARTVAVFTRS